jgi:acetyl-CoA C-acetyltransferase
VTEAYIVAARRTPILKAWGRAAALRVDDLAAPVLRAAVADAGIAPEDVDDVFLGNAAGPGGNPARLSALAAGFPVEVPGVTVDRQCGAGLEAIALAADRIAAGRARIVLAGGVESASTAPWRLEPPRVPGQAPRLAARARFTPEAFGDPDMGPAAETLARRFGVARDRQDAFALLSHRRAAALRGLGGFAAEIVPLPVAAADDGIREDTSLAALARLPPAFEEGGTVTAGNAARINDGAAAVAIVSADVWRGLGRPPALRWLDHVAAGVDPAMPAMGPVPAVRRLKARHQEAAGRVEFTEAFAAQMVACLDVLAIDPTIVNPGGGALALGHPWGASGAVLLVRLFADLCRGVEGGPPAVEHAIATLGIGGGIGLAALIERAA